MSGNQKGFIHILFLLLILAGIIVGIYLVQNPQIFRSQAEQGTKIEFVDGSGNVITQTSSPDVRVRVTYVPSGPLPSAVAHPTLLPTTAPILPTVSPSPTSLPATGGVTTCKKETKTWEQLDAELHGANYPGPYNHSQAELDAYNHAACPSQATSIIDRIKGLFSQFFNQKAFALTAGGKECVYSEGTSCHLGNCLDGSQNCSLNQNCGYVPGYSSGKEVDCRFGGGSCIYSEGNTCHQGNCLDGSQNCSFNQNCGYVSGYSSGQVVSCPGSGLALKIFGLTDYGIQIDENDKDKVPGSDQLNALKPAWVRFVYRPDKGLANLPAEIRQLVVFNNESAAPAPIGSTDINVWKNYVDSTYIPKLSEFLSNYPNVDAVEVWNEEDLCSGQSYCPRVPPAAYSYMLNRATTTIKANKGSIKVIMGGLGSGNPGYVKEVGNLGKVDAVGIHPYGKSPSGWRPDLGSTGNLQQSLKDYQEAAGDKPIWVTEIGYGTDDKDLQADYLTNTFNVFEQFNVPVVIWYAWTDSMTGGDGINHWGLMDVNSNLKPAGFAYLKFTAGGSSSFPSTFRLSNDKSTLDKAKEYDFLKNRQVVDWKLEGPPGVKTVYAQFKVNGVWKDLVSESITLKTKETSRYDLNGDGKLDQQDVLLFKQIWSSGKYSKLIDFNGDKAVNLFDYFLILKTVRSFTP